MKIREICEPVYFLEESKTQINFAAVHDKNDKTYKDLKETVPAGEGLTGVLYDQIYSKPFRIREGFLINKSISKTTKTNKR